MTDKILAWNEIFEIMTKWRIRHGEFEDYAENIETGETAKYDPYEIAEIAAELGDAYDEKY